MDSQYSTGRGEWLQRETTVSYGPMVHQVRLMPNYGEREERGERDERDERKVQGALLRTKRYNSMGTPLYLQDEKSVVMHRLIYKWSQARGSLRRVAKIRLVDTSDGGNLRRVSASTHHIAPRDT